MKGTKGDQYTKEIIVDILDEGCLDKNPRPHYEDYANGGVVDEANRTITIPNSKIEKIHEQTLGYNDVTISDKETIIQLHDNQTIHYDGDTPVIWTPAHTLSVNHKLYSYDLSKGESPLITLRPIAVKNSISELFWIYQQESNDLVEFDELLGKNTWDIDGVIHNWWKEWAIKNPDGSYNLNEKGHPHIGHCYGETVNDHDLLKTLIDGIKNDPDGRRHILCMWQVEDFKKPHGLKPCAFMTIWNVRHGKDGKDYLDMCLTQRSSDFLTAGCINQFQYVILQECIARHLGYIPGKFSWFVDNIQIYDRHVKQAKEMLIREAIDCEPKIVFNNDSTNFYDLKPNDITLVGYPREKIKSKNPQMKFPIGI